ncbi:hypothetical protein BBK36DRAFT_1142809 [Trichoderma citrinoviride]|uniref:NACHT-NTPase and P-loop NTPases N-terminal domain-containing protein n=1 Tax=Trichoderma citrinoviride TaxID=58853 RepID=A0A2T4B6C9_9HYPO|nr:hypothetical protein BBK36DRAFT_1142809 [Trichoderma citrinoviride]PTB64882.1 hypothetical protein BBK36DRAFT_1142809 [Trichoderma citrinoviride]
MSGVELLGLITGIITLIDASVKIYKAAEDASGLPPSFRDIAARLPLIQESLMLAGEGLEADSLSGKPHAALKQVLESCKARAASLRDVFQSVIPPADASPAIRRLKALKMMAKASKVGGLVDGIAGDLQVLTANHAFKAATRTQIAALAADINKKEEVKPAQEGRGGAPNMWDKGSGLQYVHTGAGNQNIASDRATQVNGTFQGGTFNFSQV